MTTYSKGKDCDNSIHDHATLQLRPSEALTQVTICINVSHACNNRRCIYCFAQGGSFGAIPRLMTVEVARKCVDWLLESFPDASSIIVNFLGGEPLLNVPAIHAFLNYSSARTANSKVEIRYFVSTNGLHVPKSFESMTREFEIGICISCDGDAESHDVLRGNTFSTVRRNLDKLLAIQPYLQTYTTVTRHNVMIADYAALFRGWGIRSMKFGHLSHDWPDLVLNSKATKIVCSQIDLLLEAYTSDIINHQTWHLAEIYNPLSVLAQGSVKKRHCGAGITYFDIDAQGNIYACHRLASDISHRLGTIFDHRRSLESENDLWPVHFADCPNCVALAICGGPCPHDVRVASSYLNDESLRQKCHLDRHWIAAAIKFGSSILADGTAARADVDSIRRYVLY
jgi:uncharacterized protein